MFTASYRSCFFLLIVFVSFLSSVFCQSFSSSSSVRAPTRFFNGINGCVYRGSTDYLASGCYEGLLVSLTPVYPAPAPFEGLCLKSNSSSTLCYDLSCYSVLGIAYCIVPVVNVSDYYLGMNIIDRASGQSVYFDRATRTNYDMQIIGPQLTSSSSSTGSTIFSTRAVFSSSSSAPVSVYRLNSVTGCQQSTTNYRVSGCYETTLITLNTPTTSPAPLTGLCLQSNSLATLCYPLTCQLSGSDSSQRFYVCPIPPINVSDAGLGMYIVDSATNTPVVANYSPDRFDVQSLGRAPLRITSVYSCWNQDNYRYTKQCYTGNTIVASLLITPLPEYSFQLLSTISSRVYELSPSGYYTNMAILIMPPVDVRDFDQPLYLRLTDGQSSMIFPTDYNSSIPFALTSLGNLTVSGVAGLDCSFAGVAGPACDAGSYVVINIPNLRFPLTPGSSSRLYSGNYYSAIISSRLGASYDYRIVDSWTTIYNSTAIQIKIPNIYPLQDRLQWLNLTVTVGDAAVKIPNAIFIGSLVSSSSAAPATVRSSSGRSSSTGGTSSSRFSSSSFITSSSSQFSSSSSSTGAGGDVIIGGDISLSGCSSVSSGGQLLGCAMCSVITISTTDQLSGSSSTSISVGTSTGFSYDCKIKTQNARSIQFYVPYASNYIAGSVLDVTIRNGVPGLSSYTIRKAMIYTGSSNPNKICGQDDYVAGGSDFSSSSNSLGTTFLIIIIVAVVVGILLLLSVILCSLWCCCGISIGCVACCVKAHKDKQQQQQQQPQQQQNGQFLGGDVLSSDASDIELTTSSPSNINDINNNARMEGETA